MNDVRVWLALGTIYVVWGSTFAAIDLAVRTIPPFLSMSVRHLIAGAVLLAWGFARSREPIGRSQVAAAVVFGGALFLGGHGALAWSQQRIPSGVAALVIASIPLWAAVLDRIAFGRRLSVRAVVGLAVGFGGVALLVDPSADGSLERVGILVSLAAAASWAAGSLYSRGATLPRDPILSAGLASVAGGVLLAVVSALGGEFGEISLGDVSGESLFGIAYLIVVGSLIGLTAYVWLLQVAPISLVATYAFVNPVIAVLIGWALLDEQLSGRVLLAGGAIVAAVAMIVTAPTPKPEWGRGLRRGAVAAER